MLHHVAKVSDRMRAAGVAALFDEPAKRPFAIPGHALRAAAAMLASVALIAVAAFALTNTLSHIDPGTLSQALSKVSGERLLEAIAFTALSYLALTGYDAAALRSMKTRASYRLIAFGAFCSYAFSFNLGFTLVTGAAMRLWIYGREGVSAAAVAGVTLAANVAFWLGLLATFGVSLFYGAGALAALDGLPALLHQILGATALTLIGAYCAFVGLAPRAIAFRGRSLTLPGPGMTLAQTLLGCVDICGAAAALYCLSPLGAQIGFAPFCAIYVIGCVVGLASHAPGGIGVFEAVMLHALGGEGAQEDLLASLLVFRAIYYFAPFALALAMLGAVEAMRRWSGLREAAQRIVGGDV